MSASETETFMILKYGSIPEAYRAWTLMSVEEQYALNNTEYEILMAYEYDMHTTGPGPFEPR